MRILVPRQTKAGIGGGITFIKNLSKALKPFGHELVSEGEYDILLIAGATLVDRDTVYNALADKKPIVLRVDNVLEDGKNRNSGMSRLDEYSKHATTIVYQSEWAKEMLMPFCGEGIVIHNGVDTDIFYPRKEKKNWEGLRIFYSKFSRNETKQFHEVIYWWREYSLNKKGDTLVLAGRYADDKIKIDHPFEFHNGEDYEYVGVVDNPNKLADILRGCDVAFIPYMFDACSNTILECQATGLPVLYSPTGGTPEIIINGKPINYELEIPSIMVKNLLEEPLYLEEIKDRLGLETMGEKYHALFEIITGKDHEV